MDYSADTTATPGAGCTSSYAALVAAVRQRAMPRVANGLRFDRRVLRDRAMLSRRVRVKPRPRRRGPRSELPEHGRMGTYADAFISLARPARSRTSPHAAPGTLKYGFGLNVEQELAKDVGVFAGWVERRKTESFAFTLSTGWPAWPVGGGARWKRHTYAATALTVSGLSGVHALYLSRGGLDFMIGDGRSATDRDRLRKLLQRRVMPGVFATIDLQHATNRPSTATAVPYGSAPCACTWSGPVGRHARPYSFCVPHLAESRSNVPRGDGQPFGQVAASGSRRNEAGRERKRSSAAHDVGILKCQVL